MSLSAIKETLLNTWIYKGKSQTSLLITITLAIIPLVIDSWMTDDSFQCPRNNRFLISYMFLFGPAFCIALLNFSFAIKYIREHDTYSPRKMIKKFIFRLLALIVMVLVIIGLSFLLSEHYVCLVLYTATPGIFSFLIRVFY